MAKSRKTLIQGATVFDIVVTDNKQFQLEAWNTAATPASRIAYTAQLLDFNPSELLVKGFKATDGDLSVEYFSTLPPNQLFCRVQKTFFLDRERLSRATQLQRFTHTKTVPIKFSAVFSFDLTTNSWREVSIVHQASDEEKQLASDEDLKKYQPSLSIEGDKQVISLKNATSINERLFCSIDSKINLHVEHIRTDNLYCATVNATKRQWLRPLITVYTLDNPADITTAKLLSSNDVETIGDLAFVTAGKTFFTNFDLTTQKSGLQAWTVSGNTLRPMIEFNPDQDNLFIRNMIPYQDSKIVSVTTKEMPPYPRSHSLMVHEVTSSLTKVDASWDLPDGLIEVNSFFTLSDQKRIILDVEKRGVLAKANTFLFFNSSIDKGPMEIEMPSNYRPVGALSRNQILCQEEKFGVAALDLDEVVPHMQNVIRSSTNDVLHINELLKLIISYCDYFIVPAHLLIPFSKFASSAVTPVSTNSSSAALSIDLKK